MTSLYRAPDVALRCSVLFFFVWVPADCSWIEQNIRTAKSGQSCAFGIPLIPANQRSDSAGSGVSSFESKISRREIILFVKGRIIGNMHFTINIRDRTVSVS